jgi:hypothetical protein
MATLKEANIALANLSLWYKVRSGDVLQLSDLPTILSLRWNYFRESWEFIKPAVENKIPSYLDPDFLDEQIKELTKFIEAQRNSKARVNPFSDATILSRYYAVFDNIEVSSIPLTNEEQRIVAANISRVQSFSKNEFVAIKTALTGYRDKFTDVIGLSDDSYNSAYGRASVAPQVNATTIDANYIRVLQDSIKSVDFILANFFAVDAVLDHFALARANANNPEINIGQYSSGRLVKLEYGEDLSSLANRFLGDPLKWIDIAIANGLKAPYIDEVGSRIPLLSNGSKNLLNISGTDASGDLNIDKLYVNQLIEVKSDTLVIPQIRKIINLRQIPVSQEIIIELSGEQDMDAFLISENAHIRVYKPNTVNSGTYVLIPSAEPLPVGRKEEIPWFLATASDDEKQTKVDLAVDSSGDLILTPNGDIKFSFGLDNAVQAMKFKISTEEGALRLHPFYGLVNILGNRSDNFEDARSQIVQSITNQVEIDPRFERIETLNVDFDNAGANAVLIELVVRLAGGGDKVIPITFTVNI